MSSTTLLRLVLRNSVPFRRYNGPKKPEFHPFMGVKLFMHSHLYKFCPTESFDIWMGSEGNFKIARAHFRMFTGRFHLTLYHSHVLCSSICIKYFRHWGKYVRQSSSSNLWQKKTTTIRQIQIHIFLNSFTKFIQKYKICESQNLYLLFNQVYEKLFLNFWANHTCSLNRTINLNKFLLCRLINCNQCWRILMII